MDKMVHLWLSIQILIVQPVDTRPPSQPSAYSRVFFRFIDWLRHRIAQASLVGDRPIFHNSQFPWVARLEAQAPAIRAELMALLAERERLPSFHELSPDVGMITSDDQWKTFVFMGYGLRSDRNLARCPATAQALREIPGLRTAFYSILEPGKRIPLHTGPYNGVLRLHLGLLVPEPAERCWIEVGASATTGRRARPWCSTTCIRTRCTTTRTAPAPCCSSTSSVPVVPRSVG